MKRRNGQKGEGRLGFAIAVVIVGVSAFLGLKIIPVRVAAYEFRDILREEARYGAVRDSDKEVHKRIMDQAAGMEIPLEKKNLKVTRSINDIVITATYEQPIDLKLTTYVFKFNHKEKAPLF
jgi:hypothetical protein